MPTGATALRLSIDIRLDHASPVRVVVEASDGALYMVEKFVKASGAGVCAAPPAGDPVLAAKTMGEMKLTDLTGSDAPARHVSIAARSSTSSIRS